MKIKSFRELRSCLRCDACRYVGLEGGGNFTFAASDFSFIIPDSDIRFG